MLPRWRWPSPRVKLQITQSSRARTGGTRSVFAIAQRRSPVRGVERCLGIRAERFGGTVVVARNSVPPGNVSRAAVFSTTRAVPTLCLVACAHRVPGSEEIAPHEPSAHARTLTVFVPSVIFLRDDAAGVCVCVRRRQPQTNRWTRERQ